MHSIPEINCGIICGCLPILPAFFQHVLRSDSQSLKFKPSRYTFSNIHRSHRHLGSGICDTDTNELELGERGLVGHDASDGVKTSVTRTNKVGQQAQKDGIWRETDIEQIYLKTTGDGL